jgi:hypothetical protein
LNARHRRRDHISRQGHHPTRYLQHAFDKPFSYPLRPNFAGRALLAARRVPGDRELPLPFLPFAMLIGIGSVGWPGAFRRSPGRWYCCAHRPRE